MSFSSLLSRMFSSKKPSHSNDLKRIKQKYPLQVLEHSVLDVNGAFLTDFTLFHHDNSFKIDLLLFLPHYGLYLGQKLSWKAQELRGASIEPASRQNSKLPATTLESTEETLHQKLEDVLSFDSTPIERFFWFEHLSEEEFDALDSSFHRLLSKERVIFSDDDIQSIQDKLIFLGTYQPLPYSKLKVVGSLSAHTLLLPTIIEPFGAFLSNTQNSFLDHILPFGIVTIEGKEGSGKTTLLVRKVLKMLLEEPLLKGIVITPTLLSGELFRRELIALCEFSIVKIDFSRLSFLHPDTPDTPLRWEEISPDISLFIFDDYPLHDIDLINNNKEKRVITSSAAQKNINTLFHLNQSYRLPTLRHTYYTHTQGALFLLLSGLRELFETKAHTPILVVLPYEKDLMRYKKAIDEYLHIDCSLLNPLFSLQYKNLEPVTLSTPEYITGVSVPHCYLINLLPDSREYRLALSRASETATIISKQI